MMDDKSDGDLQLIFQLSVDLAWGHIHILGHNITPILYYKTKCALCSELQSHPHSLLASVTHFSSKVSFFSLSQKLKRVPGIFCTYSTWVSIVLHSQIQARYSKHDKMTIILLAFDNSNFYHMGLMVEMRKTLMLTTCKHSCHRATQNGFMIAESCEGYKYCAWTI